MDAETVLRLTAALRADGIEWCICGGWGVDALLGVATRTHKDLDVFVARRDLPGIRERLRQAGYAHAYSWEENLPLDDAGECAGGDSAFVMEDGEGRSVDLHVYGREGQQVVPLWAFHRRWHWAEFAQTGAINGVSVTCLTVSVQLELHRGYDMPPDHRQDVARLEALPHADGVSRRNSGS